MPNDLKTDYEGRFSLLDGLRARLQAETEAALVNLTHIDRISFRVKSVQSFLEKATDRRTTPPYEVPLAEIEDQVAGRVIVFFLSDIPVILERLKGTFNAVERKHVRPAKDDAFGYESSHLICNIPPQAKPDGWVAVTDMPSTFELQVRTIFMHAYAEPQHDFGYKTADELPTEIRRELAWIAASAWGADQAFKRVQAWDKERQKTKN